VFSECDLVTPNDPADEDHGKGVEGHEGRVDGPLALDDTRIENHQPRHRLQTHEGRRGHLPGIVALVEPVWLGGHGESVVWRLLQSRWGKREVVNESSTCVTGPLHEFIQIHYEAPTLDPLCLVRRSCYRTSSGPLSRSRNKWVSK